MQPFNGSKTPTAVSAMKGVIFIDSKYFAHDLFALGTPQLERMST